MRYTNQTKSFKRDVLLRLIDKGESDKEIALVLDFSESWVKQLRCRYLSGGKEALKLRKPGGSVCRLSDADLASLSATLAKGSESYGLEGSFWDRKRVKYVIEQEFGVAYDIEHISDILKKINYTLQVPRKRDYRQDPEKVAVWVSETLPAIKKTRVGP